MEYNRIIRNSFSYLEHIKLNGRYFLSNLKELNDSVESALKDIREAERLLQDFQKEIYNRSQELVFIEYKNILELIRRKDYYNNKVYYDLEVYKVPAGKELQGTQEEIYYMKERLYRKVYKGTERHLALKEYKDIAANYNVNENDIKLNIKGR